MLVRSLKRIIRNYGSERYHKLKVTRNADEEMIVMMSDSATLQDFYG